MVDAAAGKSPFASDFCKVRVAHFVVVIIVLLIQEKEFAILTGTGQVHCLIIMAFSNAVMEKCRFFVKE